MGNRKYGLTNITMEFGGRTLYRIISLKNFSDVTAGDLGGWVSNKDNLSQEGDCWIYNEAKCLDDSRIYDNGTMYDDSKMCDNSAMFGNSAMFENSVMRDYSTMRDNSTMYGNSELKNRERLYGTLASKVDKFINIDTLEGEMVTGVLKDGKILYNVGSQSEISKEELLDKIHNEYETTEEYLKIIDMIELYLK